jgi:hypothetical protein
MQTELALVLRGTVARRRRRWCVALCRLRLVAMSGPATQQPSLRLAVPPDGIRANDVILRFPTLDDVDAILPAFTDPELRGAGNLPAFDRDALVASLHELPLLAERGRLLALAAVDARSREVVGGGTLHRLNAERKIVGQRRVRGSRRPCGLHTRGRRPVAADTGRKARRQDALLAAPRRMTFAQLS